MTTVLRGPAHGDGHWNDLLIPAFAARSGAANVPTFKAMANFPTVEAWHFSAAANEYLHFSVQLPHTYVEGTTMRPHVHYMPATNGAGNARFELQYSVQNVNSVFPAVTTLTVDEAMPAVASQHSIADFGTEIPGTNGAGVDLRRSCIIFGRIGRLGAHANDTYAGEVVLLSIDFHIRNLGDGSVTEFPGGLE